MENLEKLKQLLKQAPIEKSLKAEIATVMEALEQESEEQQFLNAKYKHDNIVNEGFVRKTVEILAATNNRLKKTNEELLHANEKLSKSNQELE